MTQKRLWRKHDIRFSADEKVIDLENLAAEAVYSRATDISRDRQTDGVFTFKQIRRDIGGIISDDELRGHLNDLTRVGLINEEGPDTWVVASYQKWNPTSAELDLEDAQSKAGSCLGLHRRYHLTDESEPKQGCVACQIHMTVHSQTELADCPECHRDGTDKFFQDVLASFTTETRNSSGKTDEARGGQYPPYTPTPLGGHYQSKSREEEEKSREEQRIYTPKTPSDPKPGTALQPARTAKPFKQHTPATNELCTLLAETIATHRGDPNTKPRITKAWKRDMDYLVRLGPAGIDKPTPLEPDLIRRAIQTTFTRLNCTGNNGFCWADQIQSPGALRKHWTNLSTAAKAQTNGHRTNSAAATRTQQVQDQAPLAGELARLAGAKFDD